MQKRRLFIVLGVGALLFVGVELAAPPWPPLPPLVRNARSQGGWGDGCPAPNVADRVEQAKTLAVSPEMEQRLRDQFPPGTHEEDVLRALATQRFKILSPCSTDSSVHRAEFVQKGGSLLWFPCWAQAFWKVDEKNKIVWTHGMVSYSP